MIGGCDILVVVVCGDLEVCVVGIVELVDFMGWGSVLVGCLCGWCYMF